MDVERRGLTLAEYGDLLGVSAEQRGMLLHPLQRYDLIVNPAHKAVALLQRFGAPESRDAEPVIDRYHDDTVRTRQPRPVVLRTCATLHGPAMDPKHDWQHCRSSGLCSTGRLPDVEVEASLSADLATGLHTDVTELAGWVVEAASVERQPEQIPMTDADPRACQWLNGAHSLAAQRASHTALTFPRRPSAAAAWRTRYPSRR